ncbi:MAG: MGMT family protein [Bacteroidota bacterium]
MSEVNFFEKVYNVVLLIPRGRVTTYGAIARYIGSPRSSRMVGWALNSNRFSGDYIPAHRVVNRQGLLTGKRYFGTPGVMKELLQNEGVRVHDDQVLDFQECFWDPAKELVTRHS